MRAVWVWAVCGVAACAVAAEDLGPRLELTGDVGGASFGGFPAVGGASAQTTTTTTSVTSSTTSATTGAGGAGGTMVCDDPLEPNDTEATATDLGAINDCDGNGAQIASTLTSDDVDWFRYQGSDDFGCVVDPARTFIADGPMRMCKFAACLSGTVAVTCKNGSSSATSPDGNPGCCHNQGFGMDLDCPGQDDDAIITIRFDQPTGCTDYTLNYHY